MSAAKRASVLMALLTLSAAPSLGEARPSLKAQAQQTLDAERARLAKQRSARFEARKKLTAQVRAAQAALDVARREGEQLQSELQALRRTEGDARRDADRQARDLARLERTLRGVARLDDDVPGDALAARVDQGLTARLEALSASLRTTSGEQPIIDRAGRAQTAHVVQVGHARALALGEGEDTTGLLVRVGEELRILGAPLEAPQRAALEAFVKGGGQGYLPMDLDGTLTRQSASVRKPGWLEAGGAFVWPILLVGLLGGLLLIERAYTLSRDRPAPEVLGRVEEALHAGALERAKGLVEGRHTGLDRVVHEGLSHLENSKDRREAALEAALLAEAPRLERSLSLIAAAAGVAPLLGLLGTVTGMIGTFDVIAVHGTQNPSLLSGGISMALVTTQVGLVVAVPLLLGHAWVARAVEKRQVLLEEARAAILGHVDSLGRSSEAAP